MGLNANEGDGGDLLCMEGVQNLGDCHGEEGLVVDDDGGRKDGNELAHGSSEARGILGREEERDGECGGSIDEFSGGRNAKIGMSVWVKEGRVLAAMWCCWATRATGVWGGRGGGGK